MTELAALPAWRDEEWRYADFTALEAFAPADFGQWKVIELAPGETRHKCLVLDGSGPELHRVRLTVGEGSPDLATRYPAGLLTARERDVVAGHRDGQPLVGRDPGEQ